MAEDCYFFIDESMPENERTMKVLCTRCKEEKMPHKGWFWEGSILGYGPFNFVCCLCGHIVHSPAKNEEKEKANS